MKEIGERLRQLIPSITIPSPTMFPADGDIIQPIPRDMLPTGDTILGSNDKVVGGKKRKRTRVRLIQKTHFISCSYPVLLLGLTDN